jgi:hypothetical protein
MSAEKLQAKAERLRKEAEEMEAKAKKLRQEAAIAAKKHAAATAAKERMDLDFLRSEIGRWVLEVMPRKSGIRESIAKHLATLPEARRDTLTAALARAWPAGEAKPEVEATAPAPADASRERIADEAKK